MLDGSASHRVFKISELTSAIASCLVPISRGSAANLARTCRFLEEPALSALWENQSQLETLLEVLPEETRECKYSSAFGGLMVRGLDLLFEISNVGSWLFQFRIVEEPSPEAWNRVRRYAFWMRVLNMDERLALGEDAFRRFRLNAPAGGWFPALRILHCTTTAHSLPYIDLLFSSQLETVSIFIPQWGPSTISKNLLPSLASSISSLPASALRSLWISHVMPSRDLENSISSIVLRCGPLLTHITSAIPLSDAAVNHLIQLPSLRIWIIEGPPPNYSNSSLPPVFPPLKHFTLREGVTRKWLSLFQRLEDRAAAAPGVTPLSRLKESLESLNIGGYPGPIIDSSFTSPIRMFRNIIRLGVRACCHSDRCNFKLNNNDVTELVMALPQLEDLILGFPCPQNTCVTTAACLLPISVYCVRLRELEIHFNTTRIADDLESIPMDPGFPELRSLPRCKLGRLRAHEMPLVLDMSDFQAVVDWMRDIFPSIQGIEGPPGTWSELSRKLKA